MPIYEYQCKACDEVVEAIQKIDDKPLTQCPSCKKKKLVKLVSAASFRLKGGGWYETDFKSGAKKNLAGSEAKASDKAKDATSKSDSSSK